MMMAANLYPRPSYAQKQYAITVRTVESLLYIDRVSVSLRIAGDISDGTQWRGTELTCTCLLCKF